MRRFSGKRLQKSRPNHERFDSKGKFVRMERPVFEAGITYDKDTIPEMDGVVTDTFHLWYRVLWYIAAIVMILFGLLYGIEKPISMVFFCIGSLLLAITRKIPSRVGALILHTMRGKELTMGYQFFRNHMVCTIGNQETRYDYTDFIHIVESGNYLYLFVTKSTACMIDALTVHPQPERFKDFIKEKTGKSWSFPMRREHYNLLVIFGNLLHQKIKA